MLKKLKDNNKAGSPINFVTIILISITLMLTLLDIINYARAKSALTSETEYIASLISFQGGLLDSKPSGWDDLYNISYISYVEANKYFYNNLNKALIKNPKMKLDGRDITRSFSLSYKQKANFTGEGIYQPVYLKTLGFKKTYTMKHDVPVCGFWLYRNSSL